MCDCECFGFNISYNRSPERNSVYVAIDSERDYQNTLARHQVPDQSPMEHLAIIRRIVRDMENAWYDLPGQPSMDFMRKIAATAVRCMEEHGSPVRTPSLP